MQEVSAEVVRQVKELMVQEGVTLTDDLNQCEAALLQYLRQLGKGLLQDHFSKKRWATKGRAGCAGAGRARSS